ncbi:Methylosome protein 50 [Phytophthora pseudosyringae]|uniref:Methylosome protein 50 n=1 Tax=Phytophthora pseudosyringae TaxID=221518 RepID=A0A8T1WHI1_9STRA|nr:Methylosome protein 50 [Phytophthora pseudosyringae]
MATLHPAFSSAAQVDAVAACSLPNVLSSDEDETAEEPELPLLAVAQSQLEGNVWSGGVALLDASTSERLCELQLETGVGALAWGGADGDVLALGCDDGDVRLARLSTDVAFAFVPIGGNGEEDAGWGHDDVVTGVSASSLDKTQLATCSWDLTVKLWDIGAMDQTVATFNGHTDLIWGVAMNPTHAHLLCSASQDTTVQVWDARRPQSAALVVSTRLPALSVDWHPKQPTVFSVGLEDGLVCTFDVRSPHTPLARRETHRAAVHVVKYSPYHDDLLATGGDDGKAFVTTDSFSSDRTAGSGVRELLVGQEKTAPHRDYVRALDWFQLPSTAASSADKNFDTVLATGSWDKTVHKWSVDDYTAPASADKAFSPATSGLTAPPGVPVPVA